MTEDEWQPSPSTTRPQHLDLPYEICWSFLLFLLLVSSSAFAADLVASFPFGMKDCPYSKHLFIQYLPSRERALHLASLYYKHAAWMYNPCTQGDFMDSIIVPIYGMSDSPHAVSPSLHTTHSHRLALFFILLATGALFEHSPLSPASSARSLAEQYSALARAALALDSILLEVTCATVQALFMMGHFIYNSDRKSNEERWLLTGLCSRVGQTVSFVFTLWPHVAN